MDAVEAKKQQLDERLKHVGPNVGIAFGIELFDEFKRRNWFTVETFGAVGSMLFAAPVPAYQKSHFVFPSWGVAPGDFEVGREKS
jgi:hypothetical protein